MQQKKRQQGQKKKQNKQNQQPAVQRRTKRQRRTASPSIFGKVARFGKKYILPVAKTIFGMGDYSVHNVTKANSLFTNGNYSFQKEKVMITHREFIGDIISGAPNTFNYQVFSINPGDQAVFPWLSNIAQNFESYKLHGLVFEYKTMSSDALNSTNTALGQVILSTQYDAANAPFTNKQSQEMYDGAISIKPSQSVLLGVECAPSISVLQNMYIRNDSLPAGTPIQFTDIAVLQVSTNGLQGDTVNVGELWVAYQIELIHEKLNLDVGEDYYRATADGVKSGFNNLDLVGVDTVGYRGVVLGAGKIFLGTATGHLPYGQYQLILNMQSLAFTGTIITGQNITPQFPYVNGTSSYAVASAFGGISVLNFAFSIDGPLASLDLTGITWATGPASVCDIIIVHVGQPQ